MAEQYAIYLTRRDTGLVSYFPGLEVKNSPDTDWLETILVPAILPLTRRKTKIMREMPVTFWITVRNTARYRAEILVFTTPPNPRTLIERALSQAMQSIKEGKIHAATEPLSAWGEVYPCYQLFRGKLIRFYSTFDGEEGFCVPTVVWENGAPVLNFKSIPDEATMIEDEGEQLLVYADISTLKDGPYYRKWQQAFTTIARMETGKIPRIPQT